MRGEAGREIREKFEQRIRKTERVVAEMFVKVTHGFGAEANLKLGFAVDIRLKGVGEFAVRQTRTISVA